MLIITNLQALPSRHGISSPIPWLVLPLILLLSSCGSQTSAPRGSVPPHHTPPSLVRFVNPLVGTAGDGNVFPGASSPFGMVQWSPDTSAGGLTRPGGYVYADHIITGFTLTHLSGAGCVSFGNVSFMPTTRPTLSPPLPNGSPYSDRFSHTQEHASPGTYAVTLASGISVKLVATPRTGFGRFTFPSGHAGTLVINAGAGAGGKLNTDGALDAAVQIRGNREVDGRVTAGHFCGLSNRYTLYFASVFDRPFTSYSTWHGAGVYRGKPRSRGRRSGAFVHFDRARSRTVQVKVGLSYVSIANARRNLVAEVPGWNQGRTLQSVQRNWNSHLARVNVAGGSRANRDVFYTALYHSLLHPSIFSDQNGQYIGFDNKVHTASHRAQYADFSGWDLYRCQIQLLAWLFPHETADMMASLVADAEQSGWLPKWPVANQETGEMNGDSADPILAGAYAFGARNFNARIALRFMVKGATQPGVGLGGYTERPGLRDYLTLGYIPGYDPLEIGPYGAAATTLEYAVDDFAVAQLARETGNRTLYQRFLQRSGTWRHLFNPATGLIEPRLAPNGVFPVPFNPRSMDGYTEGNALQYTWMVPQDLHALFAAMGGRAVVRARLDSLFTHLNQGPTDPYDWAGNEPGFELPWEYDFAGLPGRTQAVVRRILLTRYTTTVGGLPGNDDLGALSSWYVWGALGMYPEIPGVAGFALASPLFPGLDVTSESGQRLNIIGQGAAPDRPYATAVRLNGHPYSSQWLPLSALGRSSTLAFHLSGHPAGGRPTHGAHR